MSQGKRITMLFASTLFSAILAITSAWRPIVPAQLSTSILRQEAAAYGDTGSSYNLDDTPIAHQRILSHHDDDQCALYKVAMNQQLYFEYIHYKTNLPDMKEFTLCMWTKFTNHTNDHPLFSYAVGDQPRGILSWIANTARSSYYMMNIDGHNLYRLNYPLRLNKWYHSCQSWNGRTGEWQIWVNDERVGRGFNNRLVDHVIKGNGIAISGQEQRQLGGGFLEGEGAPPGSGGLLGEMTMVQLYDVALTAGKAHKDHKHHHAHHYEHDTSNNRPRTTTPAPVTGPPLPRNPFITGGQINHRVKINPGAHIQIVRNGVTLRHPSLPPAGPPPKIFPPINPDALEPASPSTQPQPSPYPSFASAYRPARFFENGVPQFAEAPTGELGNGNGYSFIDGRYHDLFKRDKNLAKRRSTDDDEAVPSEVVNFEAKKRVTKREALTEVKVSFVPKEDATEQDEKTVAKRDSEKKKRDLVQLSDGSLIDDTFLVPQTLNNEYFTGLASFGVQATKDATKDDEREPAEAEVRRVMDICNGCADEPFAKALIMGWRTVPKKLYSGALYLPAVQSCKAF